MAAMAGILISKPTSECTPSQFTKNFSLGSNQHGLIPEIPQVPNSSTFQGSICRFSPHVMSKLE